MLPVTLRDEAQSEFDQAFDWYDARRPGLGTKFLIEGQRVFDRVAASPARSQVVFADIRKVSVERFPYVVYYRAHAESVEVLAVFHNRRDPLVWMGRA